MFVGDSLSWNMWQSLACLVHNGAPEVRYTMNQTELVSTISFTVNFLFMSFDSNSLNKLIIQMKNHYILSLVCFDVYSGI